MSTYALPARPSLEHLRREAKRLHDELQSQQPAALARARSHAPDLPPTLSTAQRVIAREHGFASWSQLRSLVTRMEAGGVRYDTIGDRYAEYRQAEPRIAQAVLAALGDAWTVVNVGAGTGSYEPTDRPVIPVEPSTTMALQRPGALPPAVLGVAESLPLADGSADAAMAVMTMHHWTDLRRGLAEMRRVARRRAVVMTIDAAVQARMWLFAEYVPQIAAHDREVFPAIGEVVDELGPGTVVTPVPVPRDCLDGFGLAWWGRPEAALDAGARAATSGFRWLDDETERAAIGRLAADLRSGAWDGRHGRLRQRSDLDVGLRLITSELA